MLVEHRCSERIHVTRRVRKTLKERWRVDVEAHLYFAGWLEVAHGAIPPAFERRAGIKNTTSAACARRFVERRAGMVGRCEPGKGEQDDRDAHGRRQESLPGSIHALSSF